MDTNLPPSNQQPLVHNKVNFDLKLIGLVIVFIFATSLSGIVGYFFGQEKDKSSNQTEQKTVGNTIQSSPTPQIIDSREDKITEGEFSQEFINGHTYRFNYLIDKDTQLFVFNGKDSGWPISQLEQTFITGVSFNGVDVGYSDIDPSVCYQTSCKGALESIIKTEQVTMSGILSKKVEVTAYGGGGVLPLGGPPQATIYIIPYLNKFFILSGYPGDQLEKVKISFNVAKN